MIYKNVAWMDKIEAYVILSVAMKFLIGTQHVVSDGREEEVHTCKEKKHIRVWLI